MVPMTVAVLERGSSAIGNRIGLLVRVDNRCKVYLPGVNLFSQDWCNSDAYVSVKISNNKDWTYSEGFAGSIMTASFDLSSTTRYA